MIITRTPYRISFFGGGTDYPAWYHEHGGCVLATSINRYCYITCRYLPPFFEHRHRIVYSIIESVREIEEIRHPSVRESLKYLDLRDGVEIHHDGDLPARSGLGSSSSFTVGLLHALHALRGEMRTRMELAEEAIHVERECIRENVGSQDQVTAAIGGLNYIEFGPGGRIQVQPVILPESRLAAFRGHLLLFFTGMYRIASEIAAEQIRNTPHRGDELRAMKALVPQSMEILRRGDLADFGRLLHESWQLKKSLSSRITNSRIDAIYERARNAGALGGKLLGAGGGGFLLLFVEPSRQADVLAELHEFLHVPFEMEWMGSQIIFFQPSPCET